MSAGPTATSFSKIQPPDLRGLPVVASADGSPVLFLAAEQHFQVTIVDHLKSLAMVPSIPLMELRLTGQLPRQALEGTGKTITLPWEPEDFVRKLLKTRGRKHYQEVRLWMNLVAEEQGIAG